MNGETEETTRGAAKVQWQFTMSLDGFMAGSGGDMAWLAGLIGPDPVADEVRDGTGALLVGNRTFRGDDVHKDTTDGPTTAMLFRVRP
ncbi:hypothetical protein GCM10022221_29050 [Actinocorallia aurea]